MRQKKPKNGLNYAVVVMQGVSLVVIEVTIEARIGRRPKKVASVSRQERHNNDTEA
jgi:hypothetical protein